MLMHPTLPYGLGKQTETKWLQFYMGGGGACPNGYNIAWGGERGGVSWDRQKWLHNLCTTPNRAA